MIHNMDEFGNHYFEFEGRESIEIVSSLEPEKHIVIFNEGSETVSLYMKDFNQFLYEYFKLYPDVLLNIPRK